MTVKSRLTRGQMAEHLTANGFPISKSTLDKLCAPSRDEGPKPVCKWLGRPLYDPDASLAWAASRVQEVAA